MCFNYFHQKSNGFIFRNNWSNIINKHLLEQNVSLKICATLTHLYGPMNLDLDDYPPYSDKNSVIFETHINRDLRCLHGYNNCVENNDLITWVSKNSLVMLIYKFSQAG